MKERLNLRKIKALFNNFGIDLIGVADLENLKFDTVEISNRWSRAIVFGYVLSSAVLETVTDRPSLIYKHHYKTVNWILDQAGERVAHALENWGYRSLAIPASQTVDREHIRGHISHRYLGHLAGLGFIGRSGLLINPRFGARVRYATILTDLRLKPDKPLNRDCGDCRLCIDACPARAISEQGLDFERCHAQVKEFAALPGIGQNICGVCVKVCRGRS